MAQDDGDNEALLLDAATAAEATTATESTATTKPLYYFCVSNFYCHDGSVVDISGVGVAQITLQASTEPCLNDKDNNFYYMAPQQLLSAESGQAYRAAYLPVYDNVGSSGSSSSNNDNETNTIDTSVVLEFAVDWHHDSLAGLFDFDASIVTINFTSGNIVALAPNMVDLSSGAESTIASTTGTSFVVWNTATNRTDMYHRYPSTTKTPSRFQPILRIRDVTAATASRDTSSKYTLTRTRSGSTSSTSTGTSTRLSVASGNCYCDALFFECDTGDGGHSFTGSEVRCGRSSGAGSAPLYMGDYVQYQYGRKYKHKRNAVSTSPVCRQPSNQQYADMVQAAYASANEHHWTTTQPWNIAIFLALGAAVIGWAFQRRSTRTYSTRTSTSTASSREWSTGSQNRYSENNDLDRSSRWHYYR